MGSQLMQGDPVDSLLCYQVIFQNFDQEGTRLRGQLEGDACWVGNTDTLNAF